MIDREVRELEEAIEQIWEIATVKFGLDPFPVRFEIVPASVMYEVGSYALPGRYSHWTENVLFFSTSDNSDPNENGREYMIEWQSGDN